jgi:hypothetical protein
VQQAVPPAVQWSACGMQAGGGGVQTPPVQVSPAVQQGTEAEQAWLVAAQTLDDVPQVPLVAPGGMLQPRPAQQSPFTVQAPPEPTQKDWHTPPVQVPEQQSLAVVQVRPLALQVAGAWQVKLVPLKVQESGEQQDGSSAPVQAAPVGLQLDCAAQRSTPSVLGTHGAKLQHWSRNWQTAFGWMQQAGLEPSQPAGQLVVPPPKQRMIPFASALQTAFLPSQQSCDALTVPLPPQMLPGGLQAWPLVQRKLSLVEVSGGVVPAASQKTP